MPRSATLQSSYSGDPLRSLERSRAEESGKRPSKREWAEMGNRPLPESPRRAPDDGEWSPARKAAEAIFTGDAQDEPTAMSAALLAAEALFDSPKL